jgi:hypothetical protein
MIIIIRSSSSLSVQLHHPSCTQLVKIIEHIKETVRDALSHFLALELLIGTVSNQCESETKVDYVKDNPHPKIHNQLYGQRSALQKEPNANGSNYQINQLVPAHRQHCEYPAAPQ